MPHTVHLASAVWKSPRKLVQVELLANAAPAGKAPIVVGPVSHTGQEWHMSDPSADARSVDTSLHWLVVSRFHIVFQRRFLQLICLGPILRLEPLFFSYSFWSNRCLPLPCRGGTRGQWQQAVLHIRATPLTCPIIGALVLSSWRSRALAVCSLLGRYLTLLSIADLSANFLTPDLMSPRPTTGGRTDCLRLRHVDGEILLFLWPGHRPLSGWPVPLSGGPLHHEADRLSSVPSVWQFSRRTHGLTCISIWRGLIRFEWRLNISLSW